MPIRAVIDLAALRANFAALRRAAPGARAMAVVKADAYGHGAVRVAAALEAAEGFAVARLDEALALRAAGIGSGAARPVVWLKVDTGMNRLGFRPERALGARSRLLASRFAPRELRLMTHFARADEPEPEPTAAQVARFEAVLAEWTAVAGARPVTSLGNSAGTLRGAATQGDWIRPGLALYGASPLADRSAADLGLRPVMTLETRVIAVREVPVGEGVGYGATWRAVRPSRIAILAAGYADGLPRHLPSGAPVAFEAGLAPLAGRVSMDMTAVDVTDLPGVAVGGRAVLWGEGLPVEAVAGAAGTIAYGLLSAVAPRVPREYVERA